MGVKFKTYAPGAPGCKAIEKAFSSLPVRAANKWAGVGEAYNELPVGGHMRLEDLNPSEVRVWLTRRGVVHDTDFEARGTMTKNDAGEVTERYTILQKLTDKVAEKQAAVDDAGAAE